MTDAEALGARQQAVVVGCLMSVAGFFGGAMVAVLIGKWVGAARGCVPGEGLPACDWHIYAAIGGVIGLVTLPALTLRALRRSRRSADKSERG